MACDGEEAWREIQNGACPRIAILDWMMPWMDGIQVSQKIRQQEGRLHTYVLLLTAKQAAEDINGRYGSVADDYLAKPYAAQELKAQLHAARRVIELEDRLQAARSPIKMETTHDPLTGLWNRSSILEILHCGLHRGCRQGSPLAVLMADIDHLKQINHKHGHLAGDAVLREPARRVRSSIRLYDSMGRYGGGQFVIISPACDRAGALSQFERLRSRIAQETFKIFEGEFQVTTSIGIAAGIGNHHASEVISAADIALTEAKKGGRNRVELARN